MVHPIEINLSFHLLGVPTLNYNCMSFLLWYTLLLKTTIVSFYCVGLFGIGFGCSHPHILEVVAVALGVHEDVVGAVREVNVDVRLGHVERGATLGLWTPRG